MPEATFERMRKTFPQLRDIPSWHRMQHRVSLLSGIAPILYDCCVSSCVCYLGRYKDLKVCPNPKCVEPRWKSDGKTPRKSFSYLPFIPRLQLLSANLRSAKAMQYRASQHAKDRSDGIISDVFDGAHYRELLEEKVSVDGQAFDHTYFQDARDIALGFGTDGFAPFRRRKLTAWPLLLFNYNLPPTDRFKKRHTIRVGVIPGPRKPWDCDSFLVPMVEEFVKLAHGVQGFDGLTRSAFVLRAYLLLIFGDIPAVSMLMRMKGHNGVSPCRLCKIIGVRAPGVKGNTLYVPLKRPPRLGPDYVAESLPLRTPDEFQRHAMEVQFARTATESNELAVKHGIKGIALLSCLGSLSFPRSTGFEFMHLAFENTIPNLVLFWTGRYKGLDSGQKYVIPGAIWREIGAATVKSRLTIPSCFGIGTPDPFEDYGSFTAESWSMWCFFVGPVVLRGRFSSDAYYDHFCRLVRLFRMCLQLEISAKEVGELRVGFQQWVKDYER